MTQEVMLAPGVFYSGSVASAPESGRHFRVGDEEIVPIEQVDNPKLWACLMSVLSSQRPVSLVEIEKHCLELEQSAGETEALLGELENHRLLIRGRKINLEDRLERWLCHQRLYSADNISLIRSKRVGLCVPDGWRAHGAAEIAEQVFADCGFVVRHHSVTDDLSATDLLVVFADFSNDELFSQVNRSAVSASVPWIMLRQTGTAAAQLGPLFLPSRTACYACFEARTFSNRDNPLEQRIFRDHVTGSVSGLWLDWQTRLVVEMAADEILRWCVDPKLATLAGRCRYIDMLDWSTQQEKLLYLPNCPACSARQETE